MNKLCAITVSAYKCKDYIMECVNSIKSQKIPDGWDIDLRIGVDGCQETSDILIDNDIPHYWSEENVGTYIIKNSLLYLKPADVYIYFDADDVMLDGYLEENIQGAIKHELFMSRKINTDVNLTPLKTCNLIDEGRGGAMSFTYSLLIKLGGYHEFRCSCDCDFVNRAKDIGYKRELSVNQMYYRRRHKESLTMSPDTKIYSEYRNSVVKTMKSYRDSGISFIKPKTITMKHITGRLKFNLGIAVPSFKRERWLIDYFIDNMTDKLLKPLNRMINSGKITLYLSIENATEELEIELKHKALFNKYIKLLFIYTDSGGIPMCKRRNDIAEYIISNDETITHIMMMDDDLVINRNDRILDHFVNFFKCDDFLNQSGVFVGVPSSIYLEENFKDNEFILHLGRFQCFPAKYFIEMIKSCWKDIDLFNTINNGEDNVILPFVYTFMYYKCGYILPGFLKINGFDELIHLSEGWLYGSDILSDRFKRDNPNLSNEYYKEQQLFVKNIMSTYPIKDRGFSLSKSKRQMCTYIPEVFGIIFNSVGCFKIERGNLNKFISKQI